MMVFVSVGYDRRSTSWTLGIKKWIGNPSCAGTAYWRPVELNAGFVCGILAWRCRREPVLVPEVFFIHLTVPEVGQPKLVQDRHFAFLTQECIRIVQLLPSHFVRLVCVGWRDLLEADAIIKLSSYGNVILPSEIESRCR